MESRISGSERSLDVPALLQVDGLGFGYPGCMLFDGLDARIPSGVSLVRGGDGRGKTTLLRLLAGDIRADSGRLRARGVDLARDRAGYRRQVHLAGAGSEAFEQATALEALAAVRAHWPGFDADFLDLLVDGLSLAEHMRKKMFMLSTGSKRKVWLAAAFAARAPVTLVDDPFGALDAPSIRCVLGLLGDAAGDTDKAIVCAAWEAPVGVPLAAVIDLGD